MYKWYNHDSVREAYEKDEQEMPVLKMLTSVGHD